MLDFTAALFVFLLFRTRTLDFPPEAHRCDCPAKPAAADLPRGLGS